MLLVSELSMAHESVECVCAKEMPTYAGRFFRRKNSVLTVAIDRKRTESETC
jgi:hypothetical protein